jgi:DNA-binding HxlR family transcriptional regulator
MKIMEGLSRPSELRRAIPGITIKVLNERLRKLERKGVIKRKLFPGYPLHVEYLLDSGGRKLKPVVERLKRIEIPVCFIAEVISCKWMLRILDVLNQNPMRTNQIKKKIAGISNKVLAERLRKLEQMGFIQRDIITIPLGVKYSLTKQGEEFVSFIETIEPSIIHPRNTREASKGKAIKDF